MNKKTLFLYIFSLLFIVCHASSQIFLGGNFFIDKLNVDKFEGHEENEVKNLIFNPQIGYFLNENNVIGVEFDFLTYSNSYKTSTYNFDNEHFETAIFHRKYKTLSDRFSFFIHSNIGFKHQNIKSQHVIFDEPTERVEKSNSAYISFVPGLSLKITSKINMAFTFGKLHYTHSKIKETNPDYNELTGNSFGFIWNQISTGLYFKL